MNDRLHLNRSNNRRKSNGYISTYIGLQLSRYSWYNFVIGNYSRPMHASPSGHIKTAYCPRMTKTVFNNACKKSMMLMPNTKQVNVKKSQKINCFAISLAIADMFSSVFQSDVLFVSRNLMNVVLVIQNYIFNCFIRQHKEDNSLRTVGHQY